MSQDITIGLFGTCGSSTWRDDFVSLYDQLGIKYFNPQIKDRDWVPADAEIESRHLQTDDIVLLPITSETKGVGSLAEIGFIINSILSSNKLRFAIIYIDSSVDRKGLDAPTAKDIESSRSLIKSHLPHVTNDRVFIANSLDEMKKISLDLYPFLQVFKNIRRGQDVGG
jgi:hypothetical protein